MTEYQDSYKVILLEWGTRVELRTLLKTASHVDVH